MTNNKTNVETHKTIINRMKEKFRILATIYAFLLGGMILAIVFAGNVDYNDLLNISESQYLYLAIPFVAIAGSEFLYRNKMKEIKSNSTENGKTGLYQTASLMRWAVLEAATFYALIDPEVPLINIAIVLVYFILIFPRYSKFLEVVSPV